MAWRKGGRRVRVGWVRLAKGGKGRFVSFVCAPLLDLLDRGVRAPQTRRRRRAGPRATAQASVKIPLRHRLRALSLFSRAWQLAVTRAVNANLDRREARTQRRRQDAAAGCAAGRRPIDRRRSHRHTARVRVKIPMLARHARSVCLCHLWVCVPRGRKRANELERKNR